MAFFLTVSSSLSLFFAPNRLCLLKLLDKRTERGECALWTRRLLFAAFFFSLSLSTAPSLCGAIRKSKHGNPRGKFFFLVEWRRRREEEDREDEEEGALSDYCPLASSPFLPSSFSAASPSPSKLDRLLGRKKDWEEE